MLDWHRIIHRRQNIHMYHTCLDLAVLNQKVISFSGKNTTSSWILQKEKAGISYHLCVCVCECVFVLDVKQHARTRGPVSTEEI